MGSGIHVKHPEFISNIPKFSRDYHQVLHLTTVVRHIQRSLIKAFTEKRSLILSVRDDKAMHTICSRGYEINLSASSAFPQSPGHEVDPLLRVFKLTETRKGGGKAVLLSNKKRPFLIQEVCLEVCDVKMR